MSDRAKFLAERRAYICSSDVAALFGLDPFHTAGDVQVSKIYDLEDNKPSPRMRVGNILEAGIIRWLGEETGLIVSRRNLWRTKPDLHLGAHWDGAGLCDGRATPLEAKVVGHFHPRRAEFGEPGTDQVPAFLVLQCQVHMICGDADCCHVGAFVDGQELVRYSIGLDADIYEVIVAKVGVWWRRHIIEREPVVNPPPALDLLKRIKRRPKKVVRIHDSDVVCRWQAARDLRLRAEKAEKEATALMLSALGDGEFLDFGDDADVIAYLEQKRKGFTVADSVYRQLRVMKRERLEGASA